MSENTMIYQKMSDVMAEIIAVPKDRNNPQQNYKFRGVEDVMNMLQPLLAKHQVFMTSNVLDLQREERLTKAGSNLNYSIVKIEFKFHTTDGSNIAATLMGEGMDAGDKSLNKALSAAYKYLMFQTFCIPTEDMEDSEKESPEPAPKPEKQPSPDAKDGKTTLENARASVFARCGELKIPDTFIKKMAQIIFKKESRSQLTFEEWVNFRYLLDQGTSANQKKFIKEYFEQTGKDSKTVIKSFKTENNLDRNFTAQPLTSAESEVFCEYLKGLGNGQ